MKSILKKILITLAIIVGLLVIVIGVFFIQLNNATKDMVGIPSKEIVDGIFAVSNARANFFLLKSDSTYLAIDAGDNLEQTQTELHSFENNPQAIKQVLLTHSDSDHTAGIELFTNAKVYLSKDEEQMVNGSTIRFGFFKNSLSIEYSLLDDEQEIVFGDWNVRCIATPGHTPGAMCFMVNEKYLFAGDALSLKAGQVKPFVKFFSMDDETMVASIQKLAAKTDSVDYIFTAHFGYTDDAATAFAAYR